MWLIKGLEIEQKRGIKACLIQSFADFYAINEKS
jgi:hypothetical protein